MVGSVAKRGSASKRTIGPTPDPVPERLGGSTLGHDGSRPASQRTAKCRHCDYVAPYERWLWGHMRKAHPAAYRALLDAWRENEADSRRRLRDLKRDSAMVLVGACDGDDEGDDEE